MSSVNKVILLGNVGRDPEIRTMKNGDGIANLSIATSDSWTDKRSGERQESDYSSFGNSIRSALPHNRSRP